MKKISLGKQLLAEFYGCCAEAINSKDVIRTSMIAAAKAAKATIVADVFHEFNPHGISGVVVIAESHIAIHSWPEHHCASVDIFTCSDDMNSDAAIEYLTAVFKAEKVEVTIVARGQVDAELVVDSLC